MAEEEYYDDEEQYDEEGYGDEFEQSEGGLPGWLTDTPYWAISAVLHLVLLLIIGGVVILQTPEKDPKEKKILTKLIKKTDPYDPKKKRAMEKKPEIKKPITKDPIQKLKVNKVQPPKGRPKNKTNKNLNQRNVNDVFGTAGDAAGAYGDRNGRGSLSREGGSEATEEAVRAALEWLRRHQHPDGHWSCDDYFSQCKDPQNPCKIKDHGYHPGQGLKGFDVGVTGLAILAFTGYGHTHKDGEYQEYVECVRKAMKWMKKQQNTSRDKISRGLYGPFSHHEAGGDLGKEYHEANKDAKLADGVPEEWVYNHAIATMAMAELLLLSNDKIGLGRSVQMATEWCLESQHPDVGGWKYGYQSTRGADTSVTGWMVLALKTSRVCAATRLIKTDVKRFREPFKLALELFELNTQTSSGLVGYESPGDDGSFIASKYPEPYPFSKEMSCMTAVSVLCRLFAGESRRSDSIKNGVRVLMKELPSWTPQRGKRLSKINMYYWYYATYAMFQLGGRSWKDWNKKMISTLLPTEDGSQGQRVGVHDCEDGSWDPIGEWGVAGGRVYSTAIGAMTLEVYYRFKRSGKK